MDDLKSGDCVCLKSGSPPLTVHRVRSDDIVEVEWFAGPEVRRDAFRKDCLSLPGSFVPMGKLACEGDECG